MDSFSHPIAVHISNDTLKHHSKDSVHTSLLGLVRLTTQNISLVTICTTMTFGIAFLYCHLVTPKYQATTVIEINPSSPIVSLTANEIAQKSPKRDIEQYKTAVAKLSLPGLADAVLSNTTINQYISHQTKKSDDIRSPKKTYVSAITKDGPLPTRSIFVHPKNEISTYLNTVRILPIHETNLVSITAWASQPDIAPLISNTHSTTFIEHLNNRSKAMLEVNLNLLNAQITALSEQIRASEQSSTKHAKKHRLILLNNNDSSALPNQQIQSLAIKLADATAHRIKSETAFRRARKYSLKESSFLDNDIIFHLRSDLSQAEAEYASLGSQVTDAYPGMRELKAKINSLHSAIEVERSQNLRTLKTKFDADVANEEFLKQQINTEKLTLHRSARAILEYDILRQETQSLKKLHTTLQQELKATRTAQALIAPHVSIVDFAQVPTTPIFPRTNIILTLASVFGFLGGMLLSYVQRVTKNAVETIEDAKAEFSLPIIGSLPHFYGDPTSPLQPLLPVKNSNGTAPLIPNTQLIAPQGALAEALRTIRANVLLSSIDYPPRVILVSSALKGEGKTTLVSNLALALAKSQLRTLLIDADLRIHGLSKLMQTYYPSDAKGLSDTLHNQISLSEIIYQTHIDGLDIIPAGTPTENPAELLGVRNIKALLDEQRERYDFIILDSPPILPVADALLLSRAADGILFVVRCNRTSKTCVHLAKEQLHNAKARILGLILNDIPESSPNYGSEQYGENYIWNTEHTDYPSVNFSNTINS